MRRSSATVRWAEVAPIVGDDRKKDGEEVYGYGALSPGWGHENKNDTITRKMEELQNPHVLSI